MRFSIKSVDGLAYLNVGCGARMHPAWNNIDFSLSARVSKYQGLVRGFAAIGLLTADRQKNIQAISPDIIVWDLRKGIPFPDESFDAVYHSHFLEHLPRNAAPGFLNECRRVLKPNGVLRVAVPDLMKNVRLYLDTVDDPSEHEKAIESMFDQMVRTDISGARRQPPIMRWIENKVRGGAEGIGERHKWMYDAISLKRIMESLGFSEIHEKTAGGSAIGNWAKFRLDLNSDGSEYKPESLYLEACKTLSASALDIEHIAGDPSSSSGIATKVANSDRGSRISGLTTRENRS